MCGLFNGFWRVRRSLAPKIRVMIEQRAGYIQGKPPKDRVGPVQTALVLTVLTVAILGPSGWILAHLDHYKSRG
uniref:Uncharacterized protein n=1 Tax=Takifugu rubripes TaxID=31033 RepID=A0A3B5KBH3_TAKRU